MIVSTLVLYYLIFHAPLVQLEGRTSFKLPIDGVIHRISHQSSPPLNVHALQVNLIRKLQIVSTKRRVSSRTLK